MSLGNVFLGLILIAIGVLMMKFNFQLTNSFSRNNWFEMHLGSGSTYFVMKLLALLVILFGFFLMFGLHDDVLAWVLSPLTNLFRR